MTEHTGKFNVMTRGKSAEYWLTVNNKWVMDGWSVWHELAELPEDKARERAILAKRNTKFSAFIVPVGATSGAALEV